MQAPVLMTGATGWLGKRLLQVLCGGLPDLLETPEDREIRCLVPPGEGVTSIESASRQARVRVWRGDVRDPSSLAGLFAGAEGGTLYHCAGLIHPRWRTRDFLDRKSTRLNSSHSQQSRMPSSA